VGLSKSGELHPIQQVYIDEAGFQCAYDTQGFVLSTVSLLEDNPTLNREEIMEYFSGNLYRCGLYYNILNGVLIAINNHVITDNLKE
jgi:aerobic-type carbon monoxide dehydrogenase small subunit (CoxS/CutS family)